MYVRIYLCMYAVAIDEYIPLSVIVIVADCGSTNVVSLGTLSPSSKYAVKCSVCSKMLSFVMGTSTYTIDGPFGVKMASTLFSLKSLFAIAGPKNAIFSG